MTLSHHCYAVTIAPMSPTLQTAAWPTTQRPGWMYPGTFFCPSHFGNNEGLSLPLSLVAGRGFLPRPNQ